MTILDEPDMSIWEVRNKKQHFTYSQIMLWVAFDRGLRLAEKRCFPCPNRAKWMEARDKLYERVMEKGTYSPSLMSRWRDYSTLPGYNTEMGCFVQSFENNTLLDSSILIAPLVFFVAPSDPRFTNTLDRILLPPEKGGLTSTGLVYRYDAEISDDGKTRLPPPPPPPIPLPYPLPPSPSSSPPPLALHPHERRRSSATTGRMTTTANNSALPPPAGVGGKEGAFSMCTFWLVEAMTRASVYEPKYRVRAVNLFENMLGFSNHLCMFSEEIARSGEQLGNTPQAFSHLALISAAFNLDRALVGWSETR